MLSLIVNRHEKGWKRSCECCGTLAGRTRGFQKVRGWVWGIDLHLFPSLCLPRPSYIPFLEKYHSLFPDVLNIYNIICTYTEFSILSAFRLTHVYFISCVFHQVSCPAFLLPLMPILNPVHSLPCAVGTDSIGDHIPRTPKSWVSGIPESSVDKSPGGFWCGAGPIPGKYISFPESLARL